MGKGVLCIERGSRKRIFFFFFLSEEGRTSGDEHEVTGGLGRKGNFSRLLLNNIPCDCISSQKH